MMRTPLVAGQFYPASPQALRRQVEQYLTSATGEQPALLAIVPHAGYMYSGMVAGKVLARVQVPQHVLLIGPNHSGKGASAALADYHAWQTPLGTVPVAGVLNELLLQNSSIIKPDNRAHENEHSLEVELPFLQLKQPQLHISALSLGRLDWPRVERIASDLSRAITQLGQPVLMVASTDMNHYQRAEQTKQLDALAIDRIIALDPAGLQRVVEQNAISMCGVVAVSLALQAALNLGARRAELVDYAHSGMTSGDNQRVVGYAGLLVRA